MDDPVIKAKEAPKKRVGIDEETEEIGNKNAWFRQKIKLCPNESIHFTHPLSSKVKKKRTSKEHYQKFLEVLKKLQVTMTFLKVLANIPMFAKFLKVIVSNKKKLEDFAIVSLIEECSVIIQNHLLVKMKDPGNFIIPCHFEDIFVVKCLYDLGFSVNLIPLSFFRKLKLADLAPTKMIL